MIARMVARDMKSWGKSYIQVRLGGCGRETGRGEAAKNWETISTAGNQSRHYV